MLKIGSITAAQGEKAQGFIDVPGTGIKLPVMLICGREEGSACLISAGIHNAEYTGIETAVSLGRELTPEKLAGTVIVMPLLNPSGFENRTMSTVFSDGKNLNRVFPGDKNGTESERIAACLTEIIKDQADFYVDLHAGDGFEGLTPYVYYTAKAEPEVSAASREMAQHVNVLYMAGSQLDSGGAYNYAGRLGVPSVLLERGCHGLWSHNEVTAYKNDVKNILRHLSILADGVPVKRANPENLRQIVYKNAPVTGFWYPIKSPGDLVAKGEQLGEIRDVFGKVLSACTAEDDGVILYQTESLCIAENTPMIAWGIR